MILFLWHKSIFFCLIFWTCYRNIFRQSFLHRKICCFNFMFYWCFPLIFIMPQNCSFYFVNILSHKMKNSAIFKMAENTKVDKFFIRTLLLWHQIILINRVQAVALCYMVIWHFFSVFVQNKVSTDYNTGACMFVVSAVILVTFIPKWSNLLKAFF